MSSLQNDAPRPTESSCVLDASAVLALVNREPGADRVQRAVAEGASVSAVNFVEVISKLIDADVSAEQAAILIEPLELAIVDFTTAQARRAGHLRRETRAFGLSLADRACLALAGELDLPAVTADRVWSQLDIGVRIEVFR